jgi:signal recognition particle receptor subunit beta
MAAINCATRELVAKIVYYGPGLCGKTTNLQHIHRTLPQRTRGELLSLATRTDRTLFFDFLPIEVGSVAGMKIRLQLYTGPGQVSYNATRKLVLKGADGIVFVADSQTAARDMNLESLDNLEGNLRAHGVALREIPHVLQLNKRDLPAVLEVSELVGALNRYGAPHCEAVATTGRGVDLTLKMIARLVVVELTRKYGMARSRAAVVAASG